MTIYHKHRIVPGHMGGTYDTENVVLLTVEEHAEAHRLLFEEHGRWQDELAWKALSSQIGREEILSMKAIEGRKGYYHSEETKKKISESNKGNQNCLGRKDSIETRKKKSNSLIGNTRMLGKHLTDETKYKIKKSKLGIPRLDNTKQKISIKLKGRIPWNKGLKLKHATI